ASDHLRVLPGPDRGAHRGAGVELILAAESVVPALLDEGTAGDVDVWPVVGSPGELGAHHANPIALAVGVTGKHVVIVDRRAGDGRIPDDVVGPESDRLVRADVAGRRRG